jgi:MoaF-like
MESGDTMTDTFPAVGHKYIVTFRSDDGAGQFRVQLDFHSLTSLTYTGVRPDGSLSANSETVDITVEAIRDSLFLVTWKEQFGTTVVHLEDYKNNTIITNITSPTDAPNNPDFSKFHGTMQQVA